MNELARTVPAWATASTGPDQPSPRRHAAIQARSAHALLQVIQFGIPIGWPSTAAASAHIGSASVLPDLPCHSA